MILTWVAIFVVVSVGGLLAYWHFSGTQILFADRRMGKSTFDGVSDVGSASHHDGGSDGGADAGGGH